MRWICLGIALLTGACATGGGTAPIQGALSDLPATFSGTLPCADCPGIDYHLNLFQDGVFYLRTRYQDRPNGQFDDIGRYLRSSDNALIALYGGREAPLRLSIETPGRLRLMRLDGMPIESGMNYNLVRQQSLQPLEPRLVLQGMYRYLADAGRFQECLTGLDMPVAMEADNRALEIAYLGAQSRAGEPLLVGLEGRVEMRMPMEGPGPVPTLIPERFLNAKPDLSCKEPPMSAPLRTTYWRLESVDRNPLIAAQDPTRVAHLLFLQDGNVAGSDGCNRLAGSYSTQNDSIAFGQMASTMMACPDGMQTADALRIALAAATHYRILGEQLEMLDATGALRLRFVAQAQATP